MKRAFALGAIAFAPLAFAQSGSSPYVTANVAEATYDVECAAPLTCAEKDKGYKLGLGWQHNRYLAGELAYNDLGQVDFQGPSFGAFLHATAYELTAVGTYPLGGAFSVLGRLGIMRGTTKYGRDLEGKRTTTGFTYGAGLQLDFSKNVAVRLQWQRFPLKAQIDGQAEDEGDVDMLAVGLLLYPR